MTVAREAGASFSARHTVSEPMVETYMPEFLNGITRGSWSQTASRAVSWNGTGPTRPGARAKRQSWTEARGTGSTSI